MYIRAIESISPLKTLEIIGAPVKDKSSLDKKSVICSILFAGCIYCQTKTSSIGKKLSDE